MNTKLLALALASTFVFGCYAPQGDGDEGVDQAPQTFSRTVVRLNEDGTQTVAQFTVTAEQQRADVAARVARGQMSVPATAPAAPGGERVGTAAAAISTDSCSDTNAMWLFDQEDLTGHEICFIGAGTANLNTYYRTVLRHERNLISWSEAVQSFFSGTASGFFYSSNTEIWGESFGAFDKVVTTDGVVQDSDMLVLY